MNKIKRLKSYTVKISGNKSKVDYLEQQLEIIDDLSWFIFNLKQRFGIDWWFNQKKLYVQCRRMFPELNSKVVQNFIRYFYKVKKGTKLPKSTVKSSIYLDYQNFNFKINKETKITNYWLRFHCNNFPLFGKKILKKIKKTDKLNIAQIFKRNNNLYCKLIIEDQNEIIQNNGEAIVGCDVNWNRIVTSNNKFYNIKQLAHKKIEHKKNNQQKRNLTNYSLDYIKKLTTQIAKDLQQNGTKVLVLENLKNLRESSSRKFETSKGKMINYIINSWPYNIFQSMLEYKCLDRGINVEKINPTYTSKTCSRCGSRNTSRTNAKTDIIYCNDCKFQLSADLNGSRNIRIWYTKPNELLVNLAQSRTLNRLEANVF